MLGGPNVLFPTISKCVLIAVEQISFLHGQEILLAGFSGNHLVLSFAFVAAFSSPLTPFLAFPVTFPVFLSHSCLLFRHPLLRTSLAALYVPHFPSHSFSPYSPLSHPLSWSLGLHVSLSCLLLNSLPSPHAFSSSFTLLHLQTQIGEGK